MAWVVIVQRNLCEDRRFGASTSPATERDRVAITALDPFSVGHVRRSVVGQHMPEVSGFGDDLLVFVDHGQARCTYFAVSASSKAMTFCAGLSAGQPETSAWFGFSSR